MPTKPTHDPSALHLASLERVAAARRAQDARDPVLCVFLGGLAVECLLQAIVHLDTPKHDARHDLTKWLGRCPPSLQDAVKSAELRNSWSHICSVWRNEFRYYSSSAFYGTMKAMGRTRRIRGDQASVMREVAKRFHNSAVRIHNKGLVAWENYTKR